MRYHGQVHPFDAVRRIRHAPGDDHCPARAATRALGDQFRGRHGRPRLVPACPHHDDRASRPHPAWRHPNAGACPPRRSACHSRVGPAYRQIPLDRRCQLMSALDPWSRSPWVDPHPGGRPRGVQRRVRRSEVNPVPYRPPEEWSKNAQRATRMDGPLRKIVRRRPTLPHSGPCSTIGAERLSFQVRNGAGRFPLAMAAETLLRYQTSRHSTRSLRWCQVPDRISGTTQWTRI